MRILVVEDEPRIAADIRAGLERAQYAVDEASDGESAWFLAGTEDYDAIVLDLGLPKLDGLTVLKRLRASEITTPILILTARDGWRDKVEGIDAGADDYLAKPFQMEELLARLRAITRRAAGQSSAILRAGPVEIDTRTRLVTVHGSAMTLSALEYRLLSYFLHHPGRILSQSELIDHIYETGSDRDTNAIEALVARLRRKLGVDLIETRRGHGYLIPDPGR
ncbi:response regulator transcription factor [Pigmentiphaga sp.]|uniref:response regulator transcription factor n=1 Tax=Pigmentiphaga sp. TaxID=1977564 RepID=UPI00128D2633|nr:response regulator transcription factor [Pigmentiphaga sp.]MPS29212.1 response regulator transcription factor [Alcaligenaceae bacterium SAGV5]MPS54743.1 response regulator transcription factor [Alcaligenaceae bacterium SAGV3]MPT58467.1 response regulator transcription factor [Alcaligenaceae bacterium]